MVELTQFEKHSRQMDGLRTTLPGLIILPDIQVEFPKIDLAPTEFIEVKAKVPEDYLDDLCKPEDYPHFLTQLVINEFYSQRSKSAILGLRLRGYNLASNPFDFRIRPNRGYFEVPLLAHNINPYYQIQLPSEAVPLLRFFLPPIDPIKGQNLVEAARKSFSESRFSVLYQDEMSTEKIEGLKIKDELLDPNSPTAIDRVVLPIHRFGHFKKEQETINLKKLLAISSRQRGEIDKLLGLTFHPSYEDEGVLWRVIVGETGPAIFDEHTAGVIDSVLMDNPQDDFITHINSPLIDPLWGNDQPNGQPIRVEEEYIGPVIYVPKKVHVRLYRA